VFWLFRRCWHTILYNNFHAQLGVLVHIVHQYSLCSLVPRAFLSDPAHKKLSERKAWENLSRNLRQGRKDLIERGHRQSHTRRILLCCSFEAAARSDEQQLHCKACQLPALGCGADAMIKPVFACSECVDVHPCSGN
jgi:hypothetical protein